MSDVRTEPFNMIALGVKIRYPSDIRHSDDPLDKRIWVKVGHNEIAEWDPTQIATGWHGQQICSYYEDDDKDMLAEIVEGQE